MIELKLIPINLSELYPLIKYSLQGDEEILHYQRHPEKSMQECCQYIYDSIAKFYNNPVFENDMQLWNVVLQSGRVVDSIGYTVTVLNDKIPNTLYSYAIKKEYRKKVFLTSWLNAIEQITGQDYYTALYNRNTRAIDFFKKNGFEDFDNRDNTFKYLIKGPNKINTLCRLISC